MRGAHSFVQLLELRHFGRSPRDELMLLGLSCGRASCSHALSISHSRSWRAQGHSRLASSRWAARSGGLLDGSLGASDQDELVTKEVGENTTRRSVKRESGTTKSPEQGEMTVG